MIEGVRRELEKLLSETVDYVAAHVEEVPVSSEKLVRISGEGPNGSIDETEEAERNYVRFLTTGPPTSVTSPHSRRFWIGSVPTPT